MEDVGAERDGHVHVDVRATRPRMRPFAQFDALRDVAIAVARGADAEAVLALVTEHAADLVDADGCALVRFDQDGTARSLAHWARDGVSSDGLAGDPALGGDSAVPIVHRTGLPAVVGSYAAIDDPQGRLLAREYGSGAAVPITLGLGVWGALAVTSRATRAFDQRTVERLGEYARLIAPSVASSDPGARSGVEALLDTLFTSAPVGFAYIGLDGRILRANHAFAAIGGMRPQRIVNRTVAHLVDRFPMLAMADLDHLARSGEELRDVPALIPDPEHGERVLLSSFYPVARETVLGVGVVVVDVTTERRAAEDLRRERNYSAALIDALQDGLAVTAPDGTLTDVNERFCAMTGFTRDELIGATPPYPYWPAHRAADLHRTLLRALEAGESEERLEYVRADGTSLPVVVARAPLHDAAGRMKGIVATVRDVTGERRAEMERMGLLAAERLARRRALILHQMGSSLARAVTPEDVADLLAGAAATYLGAPHCHILDRIDGSVAMPPQVPADAWATSRDVATVDAVGTTGVARYLADAAATRDALPLLVGTGSWGAAAMMPLGAATAPDRGVLLLGFSAERPFPSEDRLLFETVAELVAQALERARLFAAERAAAERLRERDASRVALLRGVSHEFRSPLTAIANAAAALEQITDTDDRRDLAAVVLTETRRLDRFVANVLDLSRLEGAILEPRWDWCSPVELVAGAVEAATALTDGVAIATAVDETAPLVRADPVMTERILVNLLHNAMRHGGPPITLSVDVAGAGVRFVVRDGGPGVTAGSEDAIFEPFVGDPSRGGLGLGLALSRGLARAQDAVLALERAARGACFSLTVPLTEEAPA